MVDLPSTILVDDSGAELQDSASEAFSQDKTTEGLYLVDGEGNYLAQGSGYVAVVYDARAATFICAEINTYKGGVTTPLLVSDLGYRTQRNDVGGVQVYPAFLDQAFEIDRRVQLELTGSGSSTFGAIRVINLKQQYDAFSLMRNTNAQRVTLKLGQKFYDRTRGIYTDPPYSSLVPVFTGILGSWLVAEDIIELPIRDTLYLIDTPLQIRFFSGVGFTEGPDSFTGSPKPMARGGSAIYPITNIPPKLVDAVYNIWMFNDGPGTIQTLYENNVAVFTYAGDIADANQFFTTATPPGSYTTCNAFGLFQLGSTSVGTISADVTGTCGGKAISTAAALALAILTVDMEISTDLIDTASFYYADQAYNYTAGFYLDAQDSGLTILSRLVASIGGRLITGRDGRIALFVPPRTQDGAVPVTRFDATNIVSITPIALPASLDPPPYRWRVSYQTNYSVQASGYNPTATDQRKQFAANQFRYATWTSADVQAAWLKPGDPAPLETYLLNGNDAQKLADTLGDQWRELPSYYQIVLPITYAAGLDIGDYVQVQWPLGLLIYGATGQIVGEQQRSGDAVITYEVLFNTASQSADQSLASDYFVLDVSQLDVGILADADDVAAADQYFYLDVSELDVGVLAPGGSSGTPISNSTGSSLSGGAGGTSGGSTGGTSGTTTATDTTFVLDASLLDVGTLG